MKPRKPANKPGLNTRSYDARNKIIQKTRAKIVDARDILNQNIRDSGIDARNVLLERKKERMPMPLPMPLQSVRSPPRGVSGGLHKGRFGQRIITMSNRPGGVIQTLWDPKEERSGHGGYKSTNSSASYQSSRLNATAKPFVPRGYVDYDNMQQLEDGKRVLHMLCHECQLLEPLLTFLCSYRGNCTNAAPGQLQQPAASWSTRTHGTWLRQL